MMDLVDILYHVQRNARWHYHLPLSGLDLIILIDIVYRNLFFLRKPNVKLIDVIIINNIGHFLNRFIYGYVQRLTFLEILGHLLVLDGLKLSGSQSLFVDLSVSLVVSFLIDDILLLLLLKALLFSIKVIYFHFVLVKELFQFFIVLGNLFPFSFLPLLELSTGQFVFIFLVMEVLFILGSLLDLS